MSLSPPSADARRLAVFRKFCIITLIAVYLLIAIGASVRASGAGMGCPDWPTCFGMLVPPTSVEQLPTNYQQIYARHGYAETTFNPVKTWVEFGNRMSSLVVGGLMLLCLVYALCYLRRHVRLLVLLGGLFALTGLQGWIGSVVVASNLHPLIISTHMILALGMVAMLHTLVFLAGPVPRLARNRTNVLLIFTCGLVLLVQVGLGLQVREGIDSLQLGQTTIERSQWLHQMGSVFTLHMITSLVAVNLFAFTQFRLWRNKRIRAELGVYLLFWMLALAASLVLGALLWLLGLPAYLQPLHLFSAAVQFGMLWNLLMQLLRANAPGARRAVTAA